MKKLICIWNRFGGSFSFRSKISLLYFLTFVCLKRLQYFCTQSLFSKNFLHAFLLFLRYRKSRLYLYTLSGVWKVDNARGRSYSKKPVPVGCWSPGNYLYSTLDVCVDNKIHQILYIWSLPGSSVLQLFWQTFSGSVRRLDPWPHQQPVDVRWILLCGGVGGGMEKNYVYAFLFS